MFFHRRNAEFFQKVSLRTSARPLRLGGEKIFLALALLLTTIAQAEVINVPPNTSLQAAINAAQPGDTIQVPAGTYHGNLTLDKSLTLIGLDKPVLRGTGEGSVVTAMANGCTIKGFVVEHSGNHLQDEDSGILIKSNANRVEDNILRDIQFGIYLLSASDNLVKGNTVLGRNEIEVGSRGAGLHLYDSHRNTLTENVISETRDGMYIQNSNNNFVHHNRVTNLRYGLHYMSSNDNKFEDNLFANNVAGAALMYSYRIEFRRNSFIHNRGFSSFGILFQDCEDCIAEDNFIINNACGIFMEALRKSRFRNNVIAENDVALQIFNSSDRCEFSGNNFVENLSPLQLVGKSTNTVWQKNYWSDYGGYDLDENGIGDIGHKVQNVFEYLEGNYPRLRLYFNSPAAQALATAERTFPIIKGSSLVDAEPLTKAVAFTYPFAPAAESRNPQLLLAVASLLVFALAVLVLLCWQRPGNARAPRASASAISRLQGIENQHAGRVRSQAHSQEIEL